MRRWDWVFPRWCRILMLEAALVGFISGHFYAVHHRQPAPPLVSDAVWESMAFEAELYTIQIVAGEEFRMTDPKRWKATVTYDDDRPDDVRSFEEFAELGELLEQGPDWNEITKITIIYLRKEAS